MAAVARGLGEGERMVVVATGTLTNVALFLSVSLSGGEVGVGSAGIFFGADGELAGCRCGPNWRRRR